jgi:maltose 6'-phosphate phosphatase
MHPVQFIYVKNIVSRTVNGTFQEISFAVAVANVGYGKRVAVHWCGEDGGWRETAAEYRSPLADGREVWVAELAIPLTKESSIPGNIHFAACLEHEGKQEWDSLFGANYQSDADSGVIVFDSSPVRVIGCGPALPTGLVSLPLEIAVSQDTGPEAIAVHWSVDGWATRHLAHAYYRRDHWDRALGSNARNPNRYGWEVWAARIPVHHAYRVEFAVECRTRRGTFWDNRGGLNYRSLRGTLKAMTLNLHTYQETDQERKFTQIARAIADLGVDIVCLQEVGEHWNNGAGDWASNAARIINDQLPRPYHLHTDWSHLGFDRFREGVAILSRHPFAYVDSGYVSDSHDPYDIHSRKIAMAQIRVPYVGLVNVFSAHLSWPSDGFYPQFERLLRWTEGRQSPEVAATLLCGDFNVAACSEAFRHVVDSGAYEEQFMKIKQPAHFHRVFRERGGDSMRVLAGDGRIDFVWLNVGAQLRAIHAEELFTPSRYGRVSDHTGYLVEFELR